ncbi:MAG: XRE family transcriptional regulator [Paludibacteraceae bacterium]|nr:XRE family transcriptional regulator [Paludibacteraceae bacterium]
MSPSPIHVGSLIRAELSRQHQSVTWLAEQLDIERTNCYRFLRAQSLHVDQLTRISIAMKHNILPLKPKELTFFAKKATIFLFKKMVRALAYIKKK